MYFKASKQISFFEFGEAAGIKLNPENRWIKMSQGINWDEIENKYSKVYCLNDGAPAKPVRMSIGALLIKHIENLPDEKVAQQIEENPYMQYFCGNKEFKQAQPFEPSLMVAFRKRFPAEVIREINDMLFRKVPSENTATKESVENKECPEAVEAPKNEGTLILDTTCTPANITFPQDLKILNEAREKTEKMVEAMHAPEKGKTEKPRLDKKAARKSYLKMVKNRKKSPKKLRKAIKQQLNYLNRNLKHIEGLDKHKDQLTPKQTTELETIKKVYEQQNEMYTQKKKTVKDRIVSISQPHVRPIVRGKANADVEFGAKVSASVIDGYAFVDKISWDAHNECKDLIGIINDYYQKYKRYPAAVMADQIYRTKENIEYCTTHGIRLSGRRLGKPKEEDAATKEQAYKDNGIRNAIEGKFGNVKTSYGLDRVMAKLKETSETSIYLAVLAMNIVKRLRFFCAYLQNHLIFATIYLSSSNKKIFSQKSLTF